MVRGPRLSGRVKTGLGEALSKVRPTMSHLVELRNATKRFPNGKGGIHTAIRDVDLTVAPGEFVAVVGPTGCGKSTTLSLISGLQPASRGTVEVNGRPV